MGHCALQSVGWNAQDEIWLVNIDRCRLPEIRFSWVSLVLDALPSSVIPLMYYCTLVVPGLCIVWLTPLIGSMVRWGGGNWGKLDVSGWGMEFIDHWLLCCRIVVCWQYSTTVCTLDSALMWLIVHTVCSRHSYVWITDWLGLTSWDRRAERFSLDLGNGPMWLTDTSVQYSVQN